MAKIGDKYYNTYDRAFLASLDKNGKCPRVKFKAADGQEYEERFCGVTVYIAAMWTDAHTGRPIYSTNTTGEDYEESDDPGIGWIQATIDRELGVLLIPDEDKITKLKQNRPKECPACKITEYTVDVWIGESNIARSINVGEEEFKRVVKENFEFLNNRDNYRGQTTAYTYEFVKEEFSRDRPYPY